MKPPLLIRNATIVNQGKIFLSDVLIENGIVEKIAPSIKNIEADTIDASGLFMFPGVIDGHVHFREPGLTHKANIMTESAAAVAGGVTSFLDMPNTIPNTLSRIELANKYQLAAKKSFANFGFYIGATANNLHELALLAKNECCGVTDDGLYLTNHHSLLVEQPDLLRSVLNTSSKVVAIHSEFESTINKNLQEALTIYGEDIPVNTHCHIRSEAACYEATRLAVDIAEQCTGRLHILHVSTAKELVLFKSETNIKNKKITSEACIHHLYFSEEDYNSFGNLIKWNPSVKSHDDKIALLNGLRNHVIDIVSTDHAPHLFSEKQLSYTKSPGGGPMVQHSLVAMLELAGKQQVSLERIVQVMSHNPADLYDIKGRGYIKEGYFADLVIVNLNEKWQVQKSNILYKCGWSPFEGRIFSSKVKYTIVNGHICYRDDKVIGEPKGIRLDHY